MTLLSSKSAFISAAAVLAVTAAPQFTQVAGTDQAMAQTTACQKRYVMTWGKVQSPGKGPFGVKDTPVLCKGDLYWGYILKYGYDKFNDGADPNQKLCSVGLTVRGNLEDGEKGTGKQLCSTQDHEVTFTSPKQFLTKHSEEGPIKVIPYAGEDCSKVGRCVLTGAMTFHVK